MKDLKINLRMKKLVFIIVALCFICIDAESLSSQDTANSGVNTQIESDSKREEVQRYFGYELLLYRYLNLPYDVSINLNQQGNFVDIGFLYIVFLPILLLVFLRPKKILFYLALLYLLFTWIISTSNSFLFSKSNANLKSSQEILDNYLASVSFSQEPFSHLLAYIYKFSLTLYTPLLSLGNSISGERDYITYPIIFSLFVLFSLFLSKWMGKLNSVKKQLIIFFWIYSYYWFAFSGGIIWYGYIILIIGLFVIYLLIDKLNELDPVAHKLTKNAFLILGGIWVFIALTSRVSNIQPFTPEEDQGKGIFNPVFYDYGCAKIDRKEATDIVYSDISTALFKINQDPNNLILRFGTSLTYFIKKNNERVIIDNQLGLFNRLRQQYPDNKELAAALKASNIKYLLVDLNTATIDYTPNKSLTNKFRELLLFLLNTPECELLVTDRVIEKQDQRNRTIYVKEVFGEKIVHFGRYAIYELK